MEDQKKSNLIRDEIETQVKSIVIDSEYSTGKSNNNLSDTEFQSAIDMFECERTEKNADWRSDISIPQFFSLIVTQAATDAARNFSNRDFVESYVMEGQKTEASNADERLINRTLNQRHLHFYQKYMRLKLINYLNGESYARLWWEKKTRPILRPDKEIVQSTEMDIYGRPLEDGQTPAIIEREVLVPDEEIVYDRFNFDPIDPRNVFTDNTYCYSLQEKQYVIIRSETSLEKLRGEAERNEYFNLDKLQEIKPQGDTETSSETYNKNKKATKPDKTPSKNFDKLERFGKFWVVIKEEYPDGYPMKVEPGIDGFGDKKDNAEYIECLITFIKNASMTVLIGFQPQKCRDATGLPYRPIVRGIHYIHPTEDSGMGDGKSQRELQVAIDDTFNINNDRVMLAAIPTLKVKKFGNQDNATLRIAPEHVIELEDVNDLQEIRIDDNIAGSTMQIQFLKMMSEQAFAQSPSTMGMLPQDSSVTATAIAGADSRANTRDSYKSLTFENTFETSFYWMISQLTWQYSEEETANKLLGDKFLDFDPDGDYYWKPVSQSVETEYAKSTKIKQLVNMVGLVAPLENPKTAALINFMIGKILSMMGDENDVFAKFLLDPNAAPPGGGQTPQQQDQTTSNQAGLPQSDIETGARENLQEMAI